MHRRPAMEPPELSPASKWGQVQQSSISLGAGVRPHLRTRRWVVEPDPNTRNRRTLMADKKIIAVVGATGQQGSGLVKAILADPSGGFAARAITRDPGSDKARELARLGAEVVAGDVDDEESLKKAFAGAYGAYCVTFFWAHFSPERETAQATAMARAAKAAGV